MISIKYSLIKKLVFVYIALPLICFFIGWLRWYYAAFACAAVLTCLFFVFKQREKETDEALDVSIVFLIVLIVVSVLFCVYCGIGRLWAQSKDYPWRNAIFRDIILREWPVIYDKYEGALSYYIALWLPPALIGKLSLLINNNSELAFRVGNITLLAYSSLGIILLFLLILLYLKPTKKFQFYLAVFMFIFFSGMDILGSIEPLGANNYHLEWWADKYQYSSFTTCMCWVFNQSIIPWLCMLLILKEKKVSFFVFTGMCCLLSGPLPFIGLFIYCISVGIYRFVNSIKEKKVKDCLKEVFSVSNILSVVCIFPFLGFYLLSNASFQGGGGLQLTNEAVNLAETVGDAGAGSVFSDIINYVVFILFEFLILMILLFRKNIKNYLYYVTLIMLLIFPFIKVGYAYDFVMRASIPSLLYLYLISVKFVFEESYVLKKQKDELVENKKYLKDLFLRYSYILVIACLVLGAFTPAVEFIRGFRQVKLRGVDDIMTDYLYTLGEDSESSFAIDGDELSFTNFVAVNYKETFFFSYFSKTK